MAVEYKECYIAFLDILGFKNKIGKDDVKSIYSIFEKIQKHPFSEISKSEYYDKNKIIADSSILTTKIMSDSVVIMAETKYSNAFFSVLMACFNLQVTLLQQMKPVLLRGGITKGQIYIDNDIMFGPGLVDAYVLQEKCAKNPRIILTGKVFEEAEKEEAAKHYVTRDVDGFYKADYLKYFMLSGQKVEWLEYVRDCCKHVLDCKSDDMLDANVRSKYIYFEKELNFYIQEYVKKELR